MDETAVALSETDLEFPESPMQLVLYRIVLGFAAASALSAAGFSGWMLAETLLRGASAPSSVLAILVWSGGLIMALGLAFLVTRIRPFSVQNRTMTLRTPILLAAGARTRHVPLNLISHAVVIGPPDADSGVLLTLEDGTRFPIFDGDLPEGGAAFLRRLAGAIARTSKSATGLLQGKA